MYEKILVAIDESEVSERVLTAAEDLARLSGGEISGCCTSGRASLRSTSGSVQSYEDAHSWLNAAAEKLAASGIKAHPVVVANLFGYAAREITNIAVALEVSVIFMGTRGRNGVTELLAGSTAHKVLHLADRPVVVVR